MGTDTNVNARDEAKATAVALLERYDQLRNELRALEHDLSRACATYGRTVGLWGFNRDYLRTQLAREKTDAA